MPPAKPRTLTRAEPPKTRKLKLTRAERVQLEHDLAGKYARRLDVRMFMERASNDPCIKSVEVTAHGMKVEFQGLPVEVAFKLLNLLDTARAEARSAAV
jgi:hypothetical protein